MTGPGVRHPGPEPRCGVRGGEVADRVDEENDEQEAYDEGLDDDDLSDHDDGEVTATMKVRRSSVHRAYFSEIEAMYR